MTKKEPREFTVRSYIPEDREQALEVWERQKASFPTPDLLTFPDPSHPHQFFSCVVEDNETGKVVGLGGVRVYAEGAMILDPAWGTPRDRLHAAQRMIVAGGRAAWLNKLEILFMRVVGKVRWADRLVEKCGMELDSWPVVKFDLEKAFGRPR